jgi:hypothetical protein
MKYRLNLLGTAKSLPAFRAAVTLKRNPRLPVVTFFDRKSEVGAFRRHLGPPVHAVTLSHFFRLESFSPGTVTV